MSRMVLFLHLPRHEQVAVIEAAARLAIAPAALRVLGARHFLATGDDMPQAAPPGLMPARIVQLVESVSLALPWRTTCLHRAIVTAAMLTRRGLPCGVTIGVRRDTRGFAAHAWAGVRDREAAGYTPLEPGQSGRRSAPR